jgi:predicted RNase H-like nuclease
VRVAGVDGCRAGWVVADDAGVVVVASFADVLALSHDVVGVDIPIGLLSEPGPRACDVEARRLLGRPRASSVFPAPPRAALAWRSWADASGLSRQAFNLLAKIGEVDALMTPSLQDRVFEVHPEVSFAVMAGAPMAHAKRTAAGRAERLGLLPASAGSASVRGAAGDDVLDAYAVLWSARRAAEGQARRLGADEVDARGLRMEIMA